MCGYIKYLFTDTVQFPFGAGALLETWGATGAAGIK